MFSKELNIHIQSKPIEESIIQPIEKPKAWIHIQNPAPTHRFAYSHRCILCMSALHTTLKCPQLQKNK